jgi:hypothetical protein
MSYGLLGLKGKMEGEALQGLQELSGQQRENKRLEDQMDQASKAQNQQTGMLVGAAGGAWAGAKIGAVGGPMGMAVGAAVGFLAGSLF